jgi:hypothetical protein
MIEIFGQLLAVLDESDIIGKATLVPSFPDKAPIVLVVIRYQDRQRLSRGTHWCFLLNSFSFDP